MIRPTSSAIVRGEELSPTIGLSEERLRVSELLPLPFLNRIARETALALA